jgi:hypothetical protein
MVKSSGVHAVEAVAMGVGAPQDTPGRAFQSQNPVPGVIPAIHGTACTS